MKRAFRRPAHGKQLERGPYCVGFPAASRLRRTCLAALGAATSLALFSTPPTAAEEAAARVDEEATAQVAAATPSQGTAVKNQPAPTSEALKGTPVPKPVAATPEEAAYVAVLDAAIEPVRRIDVAASDATRLREAVAAVAARNLSKAAEIQAQIADPLARKIVDWYRLRSGHGDIDGYRAFLAANAAWPDRGLITQRLEEALFTRGGSSAAMRSHFDRGEPRTGPGIAALASALLSEGKTSEAKALAAKAWRETMIPASHEKVFLDRFGAHLTEADHKWRLDKLLMEEIRWTGARNERAQIVRRLIPLLSEREQKKAQARLAVYLRAKDARKLLDALPGDGPPDWGLTLSRIQMLRRAKQTTAAAKLLLSAPTDPAEIVSPDDWWEERRANAYEALDERNPKLAYELVRDAGPLSVNPLKEQAFMAGWLAFRLLNDPARAEAHFAAMAKAADGPLSRAKSRYWLGRVAEKRGQSGKAAEHYRAATQDIDTFHGQLALLKLEPRNRALPLKPPAMPSREEIRRFVEHDAVNAAVIARKANLSLPLTRAFLNGLRTHARSEGEMALVAHLAEALGDTQAAVRIAKSAVARGQNLITYAYPVHPFPAYTALRQPPEAALLLGIARQESEFNTRTQSGAGARGLLQVMPVTARHVCRDYKVRCDIPRLLTDMSYNTSLASAYIADRMDEFRGSYVLAIAGYNAGPGRARQWIRRFGDPRDPKVDVIDWIERIPFKETREYVGKVLSNVQIYRARLGDSRPLRLTEDFARARGSASAAP